MSAVVSDSSPLNYFALLSDFDLLRKIYGTLVIPPAVYHEVVERGRGFPVRQAVLDALDVWIHVTEAPKPEQVASLRQEYRLDLGESEAILAAEALGNAALLMDDQRGVECARSRGMIVIRTPLIYADAKILGLIDSVRVKLDGLRACGFRLSDAHYDLILKELGEL